MDVTTKIKDIGDLNIMIQSGVLNSDLLRGIWDDI